MASLRAVFASFAECQMAVLSHPGLDSKEEVAQEMLHLLDHVPEMMRDTVDQAVRTLDSQARKRRGAGFSELPLDDRIKVLEGLEARGDHRIMHGLVSQIARLGWIVIHSRPAAREFVGFSSRRDEAPVEVAEPSPADLHEEYDLCIVGSGAAGATVAARIAEERPDLEVLLLEEGRFISPHQLSQRDDRGLIDLYRNAGVQPAFSFLDAIFEPEEFGVINVLQARVVGGGPYVNNAIHWPIEDRTLARWQRDWSFPLSHAQVARGLAQVDARLTPSELATNHGTRARSRRFAAAAQSVPQADVGLLETVLESCVGCGACNIGCRYGRKIGGPGSGAAGHRPSELERALAAGVALRSSFEVRRLRLRGGNTRTAWALEGVDLSRGRRRMTVRARSYLLAAGPIASTRILQRSGARPERFPGPLGSRFSGNIVMPVFAVLGDPFAEDPLGNEPGLPMCFKVMTDGRPLLETWFHYPASLALGVPGWLRDNADVLREYPRLGACGVVVPSDNRGQVPSTLAEAHLSISSQELTRLLEGIAHIADIWFDGGAEVIIPATRLPLPLGRDVGGYEACLDQLKRAVAGPADLTLSTAHPQGGNPMGLRKRRAVVGPDFRVFGLDNVSVADASIFPAGCEVNPQKTVMALAHLAADALMARL